MHVVKSEEESKSSELTSEHMSSSQDNMQFSESPIQIGGVQF